MMAMSAELLVGMVALPAMANPSCDFYTSSGDGIELVACPLFPSDVLDEETARRTGRSRPASTTMADRTSRWARSNGGPPFSDWSLIILYVVTPAIQYQPLKMQQTTTKNQQNQIPKLLDLPSSR
ncbi:hypothetical protein ACP4OV_014071 [Aristida adscensionis]